MKVNVTFWAAVLCCCYGLLMPNTLLANALADADLTCGNTGELNVNGSTVTINNLKILNQGSATAGTFRVGYYLSTNTIITTNDHLVGTDVINTLAANDASTQSFSIDVETTDVPPGTYYVGIIIDYEDTVDETDEENNNCFYSTPQVVVSDSNAKPNLVCASTGTLTVDGSMIIVSNTRVKNEGNVASELSYIGFYLSEDQNFTTDDILIGSQLVNSLQPWASSSESITVNVENMAHIPQGTYYVGSIIDFDNRVDESDETDNNNCFFDDQQVTIGNTSSTGMPDLTCFDNGTLSIEDNVITIADLQVKNEGDADAVASEVGYYLSTDETFTTNDILIGTDDVEALAAGAISTEDITVDVSTLNIAAGTYFVGIIVDHTNKVSEPHEIEEDVENDDQSNVCYFVSPKLVIEAQPQKPDLQCDAPGYLSVNGSVVSLTNLTIVNAGDADAGESYVRYYLSTDQNFDADEDIVLGSDYVSPLTVGMRSTESVTIDLNTLDIPEGTYFFGSIIDYNNQVSELNEDNNNNCFFENPQIVIGAQQPQLPDLSCESRGTLSVDGTTITISNSIIKNAGEGAAGSSVLGYYLSPNTNFTTNDILIGTINVSELSSWASTTKTFSVDISTLDIPSGTYYIGFIIDKNEDVEETDEDNNNDCFFNSPTITINNTPSLPDLTCQQYASLSISGTQVTISNFTVQNVGNGSSVATNIGYYLSTDTDFSTDDFLFGTDAVPALQPGGSSTESISTDVDNGSIPPGTYYVGVIIDYENNVEESSESNNRCFFTNKQVTIEDAPQLPDLICDNNGMLTVNGSQITLTNVRIKNVGNGMAGVSYIGYYLSTDQNFTTDDFLIGSDYINALGPWASSTESFSVDISGLNIPEGTYYVGIIIDYQEDVTETDENNNICFFDDPQVVVGSTHQDPDLTCLSRGYLTVDGTHINLSNVQIKNASDVDISTASYVGYYLSTDQNFTTADYLIGTDYVGPLAAHAISTENFSADASNAGVPPGTYFLGIIIDYQDRVTESNEGNNVCFFTSPKVTIGADMAPDLACATAGYLFMNGTTLNLSSVRVQNIGNKTSSSTRIGYYLSADQDINTSDFFIGSDLISSLNPSATETESFYIDLSTIDVPAGTYYLGIIIDYENNVSESNEANNICFINYPQVTVDDSASKPDLTCDYRGNLSSSGSYLTISNVRVKNIGNSDSGPSYIGYYLSTDQNITTSDIFLGQDYVGNLMPWGASVESLTIDINSLNIPAGTYYVGIIIDYRDEVDERDETNNICFFDSPRVNIGGGSNTHKPNLTCEDRGTLTVSGTSVTLSDLRIKNIGQGTASASTVGYYLSTDENFTTSDYLIGTDAVSSLSSGMTSIEHFTTDLAGSGIPAGNYFFGIIIDYQQEVSETNEYDNICFFSSPQVVLGGGTGGGYMPDLACFDNGTLTISGSSVRINGLVVKNIGSANAASSRVGYYLSTDPIITTADNLIGDDYVANLNAGSSSVESFFVDVSTLGLANDTYYIGAIIDYNDVVNESDETNNNVCHYTETITINNGGGTTGGDTRCAAATDISCNQVISGSTFSGATNDFSNPDYAGCHSSSSTFNAPDVLYSITVADNSTLKLRLFDLSNDLDLFVLSECGSSPVCVAKSTNGNTAEEEVTINNASGTYFIVVDGYSPSIKSNFKLETTCTDGGTIGGTAECVCPAPTVDEFCDDFESYQLGAIGPQSSCWSTFNAVTEDVDQDGQVVSMNRDQQLRISNDQRAILLLGDRRTNIHLIKMNVLVPEGNYVQINPVKQINTGGYNLACRVLFIGDGRGLFNVNGQFYDFDYPNGQEFELSFSISLAGTTPLGRFFINGERQYIWQMKHTPGGTDDIIRLMGVEFRTDDEQTGEFFIDDVSYNKINTTSNAVGDSDVFAGEPSISASNQATGATTPTITAFPNPSTGAFTTTVTLPDAGNYKLDVIDINGQIIRSFDEQNSMQQSYQIELAEQPNGVYYLRLQTAREVITQQMVLLR